MAKSILTSSSRVSISALDNFQRLAFRVSDYDDMLILDGQDDLIQCIFHGLETLYFCPTYSLTLEKTLALLLTSTESEMCLMGHIFEDQVDVLTSLVQQTFSFDTIQLMLHVVCCIYPQYPLRLYRSSTDVQNLSPSEQSEYDDHHHTISSNIMNNNSNDTGSTPTCTVQDITTSTIDIHPGQLWYLLLWGECLHMHAFTHACRTQIVSVLLPKVPPKFPASTNTHGSNKEEIQLFQYIPLAGGEAEREEVKAALLRHFLAYGPTLKQVLSNNINSNNNSNNNTNHSNSSGTHSTTQKLSVSDLHSAAPNHRRSNQSIHSNHNDSNNIDRNDNGTMINPYHTNEGFHVSSPPLHPPKPPTTTTSNSPAGVMDLDHFLDNNTDNDYRPLGNEKMKRVASHNDTHVDYHRSNRGNIDKKANNGNTNHEKRRSNDYQEKEEDVSDNATIDSWGTYADETSRLRSLRRSQQKDNSSNNSNAANKNNAHTVTGSNSTPKKQQEHYHNHAHSNGSNGNNSHSSSSSNHQIVDMTPQRKLVPPQPIPPHNHPHNQSHNYHPTNQNQNMNSIKNNHNHHTYDHNHSNSASHDVISKSLNTPKLVRSRSLSPSTFRNHSSNNNSNNSNNKNVNNNNDTRNSAEKAVSSSVNLELAREIAMLRLRHVKIQRELEKSKLQAMTVLKQTSLQSLALKTAVIRVASRNNTTNSHTNNNSKNNTKYDNRHTANSTKTNTSDEDPYEVARQQEIVRQENLSYQARQRALQRIQETKQAEMKARAFQERQQQYKQSLQRQQREQTISKLVHHNPITIDNSNNTNTNTSSTNNNTSTSAKPTSISTKHVTFASNNGKSNNNSSTVHNQRQQTEESLLLLEETLPTHHQQHHRYSVAALQAVAQGLSPTRAIDNTTNNNHSTNNNNNKLSWPTPAQLQKIKQRQAQLQLQHNIQHKHNNNPNNPNNSTNNSTNNRTNNSTNHSTNHSANHSNNNSTTNSIRTSSQKLKPPHRDVSPPPPPVSMKTNAVVNNTSSSNMNNSRNSSSNSSRIGGKYSPPRSISDFETTHTTSIGHTNNANNTSSSNDDYCRTEDTDYFHDSVNPNNDMDNNSNMYMVEMSLGKIADLCDDHCMGALQHLYLVLKHFPAAHSKNSSALTQPQHDHTSSSSVYDSHHMTVIRTPSIRCQLAGDQQHYSGDFLGTCVHFPLSTDAVLHTTDDSRNSQNQDKVSIEVYVQQASIADVCIAKTETALVDLFPTNHNHSSSSDENVSDRNRWKLTAQTCWHTMVLQDPVKRSGVAAGALEMAVQIVPLYA